MAQQDLQASITSLEASTAATNRQCEILHAQKKYLASLGNERFANNHRSRTRQLESQHLTLAIADHSQELNSQLQELEQGLQAQINQVESLLNHHLRRDDFFLQELAAASVLDVDDENDMLARVTTLTAKLGDLTREEIQSRLDRTYLQHLIHQAGDLDDDQSHLHLELEQDLDSLHVEIPDVAAMSAVQNYQSPLIQALVDQQRGKNMQAQSVLEDINDSMTTLNQRARTLIHQLEDLISSQMAIFAYQHEFKTLEQEFLNKMDARTHTRAQHDQVLSRAMSDILEHWNVHITEQGTAEHALWAKKRKLEQDVQRSKTTLDDALLAHLEKLPRNMEQLLRTDTTADQEIDELEQEMHELRDAVERVNLASIDKEDKTQARFLARWAEER